MTNLIVCTLIVAISGSSVDASVTFGVSPTGEVHRIDLQSGATQLIANTGNEWIGATNSDRAGSLFATPGFDDLWDSVYRIDGATGIATAIGSYGGAEIKELAYDSTGRVLYASDQDELYTIDLTSGAASLVGRFFGPSSILAMEYVPSAGGLIGIDFATNNMYRINASTGRATLLGNTGINRIADIWYDQDSGILFGITNFVGDVYQLNPSNADALFLHSTGLHITGLGGVIPSPPTVLLGLLAMMSPTRARRS